MLFFLFFFFPFKKNKMIVMQSFFLLIFLCESQNVLFLQSGFKKTWLMKELVFNFTLCQAVSMSFFTEWF